MPSYPVGYVDQLEMHSMDFEEFSWANGVTRESIQGIITRHKNTQQKFNEKIRKKVLTNNFTYCIIILQAALGGKKIDFAQPPAAK